MTREEVIQLIDNQKSAQDNEKLRNYFSDFNNIQSNRNTIVFYVSGRTGTSVFRLEAQMFAIYKLTNEFNLVYTEQLPPSLVNLAELLIIHRASDKGYEVENVLKCWASDKIKPFVIHNVDDNESILPKSHPLYSVWKMNNRDKQSIHSLRNSDAVEITTHKLKQYCLNHNKNTFISRNQFNWKNPQWNLTKKRPIQEFITNATEEQIKHFEFPENWNEKIVINWAGLTSHFNDLEKMAPIMKALHDKYSNVVFCIAGMALKDSYIEVDQATGKMTEKPIPIEQTYRYRVTELFKGFEPERLRVFDALQTEEYGWFFSLSDLGMVFVEHNTFNQCKSEIKAVEYLKYKSIPVISKFGGYEDLYDILLKEGKFSPQLLDKFFTKSEFDPHEWVQRFSNLIDGFYTEEQQKAAEELSVFCTQFWDIDSSIANRLSIYKNFIEKNIENQEVAIQNLQFEFA